MSNVTDIDDYRSHLIVHLLNGSVDVCPKVMFENIISGDLKLSDTEDGELLIRSIIKEWLDAL